MRVTGLRVYEFELDGLPHAMVRVRLASGAAGFGEASDGYGFAYPSLVRAVVQDVIAPLLGGREFSSVAQAVALMKSELRRRPGLAGSVAPAIGSVETALWDAVGRQCGRSVHELLGGHRTSIPVYASSFFLFQGDAEWHLRALAPWLERGVSAVKLRVGLDWRQDLATLAQIRALLGPDLDIYVDGTEHFSVDTALRIGRVLADLGVTMFEEPVPQERHQGVERLVRRSEVAIGYGEHFGMSHEYDDALRHGRVDVVQPDPATSGGLLEVLRIGEIAERMGVPIVPHSAAGPVAFAANMHACSVLTTFRVLEFPYSMAAFWHEILDQACFTLADMADGAFALPAGAGLGIEVNESALARRATVTDVELPAGRGGWPDWSQGSV